MAFAQRPLLIAALAKARAFAPSQGGAIAVEFGFIFPIILTILLGLIEASTAISANLAVQTAARTGAHFGLVKPPIQGDMAPVISAVRAALPPEWVATDTETPAEISANLLCECELTGPVQCGVQCSAGEQSMTYLKVDVAKTYTPLVTLRYFSPTFKFQNSTQVRLK
jgi:hypothetical protein